MSSITQQELDAQLNTVRLEGIINTRFAEMRADNRELFNKIERIETSTLETSKVLKEHLENQSLHLCVKHSDDIDSAWDRIRKLEQTEKENKKKISDEVQTLKDDEQAFKNKIKGISWFAGVVLTVIAMFPEIKEFIEWLKTL